MAQCVALMTSGGDCSGMNSFIRSSARLALQKGFRVFVILNGWEGAVQGNDDNDGTLPETQSGEPAQTIGRILTEGQTDVKLRGRNIVELCWDDVRGFNSIGGTLIGTARSAAFRTPEGRRRAAANLIRHGISSLLICGGDGSLTGADLLRAEWPDHVAALLAEGVIGEEARAAAERLRIVGLVGSIDNDFNGTDVTIGAFTALHRICESIDSISSTAASHSRAFVIEVMGRHCGWLALMAGLATGADYVFIPESPPLSGESWSDEMVDVLKKHRSLGKRKTIILIAEGAIDRNLAPISAEMVKTVLENQLRLDTRVTCLGHTQRGGLPCALDRILATLQSAKAVDCLVNPPEFTPVICQVNGTILPLPLPDCVAKTKSVADAINDKDFTKAVKLRDSHFGECFGILRRLSGLDVPTPFTATHLSDRQASPAPYHIGILNIGAPAAGTNAAVRSATRYLLNLGHVPVGIYNGLSGLIEHTFEDLTWLSVDSWSTLGGSELGTNRTLPDQSNVIDILRGIASANLDGLFVIGGFEALLTIDFLSQYTSLPLVQLPATISNNVPLTTYSLGSDTALNAIVTSCDNIKQSASSSRNRVFVVETQGGQAGYLGVYGGLAAGAVCVYTPENGINLRMLDDDVKYLKRRYENDIKGRAEGRLVIRSDKASKTYSTQVITDILDFEGKPDFDARSVSLGHTLQGGVPSPRDRVTGVRFSVRCIDHIISLIQSPDHQKKNAYSIVVENGQIRFATIDEMIQNADIKKRMGKKAWWMETKGLIDILAGRKQ